MSCCVGRKVGISFFDNEIDLGRLFLGTGSSAAPAAAPAAATTKGAQAPPPPAREGSQTGWFGKPQKDGKGDAWDLPDEAERRRLMLERKKSSHWWGRHLGADSHTVGPGRRALRWHLARGRA